MGFQLKRIVVPIDDTPLSDKALDAAYSLASRFGARVVVVAVRRETEPANVAEQQRDEAEWEFELAAVRDTAVLRLKKGGHPLPEDHVEADVRTGWTVDCILEAANDHHADLLVMGTHGPKGLTDRVMGTTTERVLLRGRCALLVVREDDDTTA